MERGEEPTRKLAVVAALAAATFASAPDAQAHPSYHYQGGCASQMVATDDSDVPTWVVGTEIAAVVTDAAGVPRPVNITVVCSVRVDGIFRFRGAHGSSAFGVVVDVIPSTAYLTTSVDSFVEVCEEVWLGGVSPDSKEYHDGGCAEVTRVRPGIV